MKNQENQQAACARLSAWRLLGRQVLAHAGHRPRPDFACKMSDEEDDIRIVLEARVASPSSPPPLLKLLHDPASRLIYLLPKQGSLLMEYFPKTSPYKLLGRPVDGNLAFVLKHTYGNKTYISTTYKCMF